MRISNEALAVLRGELPRGSVPQIKRRLKKRQITFSAQYIYRCLDPDQPDYNTTIIDEAISLGEELLKGAENMEERVLQLRRALQ
ncbi:MAG TPA: hypothetical protein PK892_11270 [Bacteroidales bacterium]|nr:hypothetical protein [Bacteroidales bacterium]